MTKTKRLINITINPDGTITTKSGLTIKPISSEASFIKSKEKGREWK